MAKINGGATLWARKTLDSDIFYNKPPVWFKIWFYLVNRVNHKDNKHFKRGSCFLKYEWIMDKTGATYNQIKHCLEFLKSARQIATQKKKRGMLLTVINYNFYQTLDNYYYTESQTKRKTKARQKPDKSQTHINKNEKNDKNLKKDINKIPITNFREYKKKPANEIEFDFELWSWHGIDDDIKDRWAKIFPNVEVEIELNKIRKYFKSHPKHEQVIKTKFNNNYSIYIFDWLVRAEKYIKDNESL